MIDYIEFDQELSKCPITTINTIQDVEKIRDFYFTIIDQFNLGHNALNITSCLDKDVSLIINCDRNRIFNIKLITKLDNHDKVDLDYNKYCYYNISNFNELINDYKSFINNNDTSFLEYWSQGNQDDSDRYDKHIKDRNIILSSYSLTITI